MKLFRIFRVLYRKFFILRKVLVGDRLESWLVRFCLFYVKVYELFNDILEFSFRIVLYSFIYIGNLYFNYFSVRFRNIVKEVGD